MRTIPLTVFLWACASAAEMHEPATAEAISVTTAPIEVREVARPVHGTGRVQATDQALLSFPFGGVASDVRVVRGQQVRRGEVLAVLDASAARAQLVAARSALAKAERDATRAEALEGTALSVAQRQDALTGLEVARANVDAASFQARRSALVAPADGVVVDVWVDEDQTVGAGQPVVSFAGVDGYEVELVLPAADALLVDVGTEATARIGALGRTVTGRVTERAGGAGPLGGFTVVVALDAEGGPLAPGLVASVDLRPTGEPLATVPVEALAEADGDEGAVYVVEDGTAHRVPVTVAFLADPLVALRSAPPAGTEIVVSGVAFVTDGASVVSR
ncbi:MAG: efflux RND transporter periplasmic adaptor subunit [Alphaproteobacteria bacterium]|nr:efflux RND transporter periplasmic adaptor subunit [Alphaproteobacteria bacterium]MCB9699736.1 efflux RND transporter periplasmic adaptor subunit [Alphaproteobacteria bacterium]